MVNCFSKKMAFMSTAKKFAIVPIGLCALISAPAFALVTDVIPSVNYKIVHSFDGNNTGSDPFNVGITLGKDGSLYGTTLSGGKLPNGQYGSGTVYKINPQGKVSVLHVFDGQAGSSPTAALTLARDGSLIGTTYMGGKQRFDTGVVYKIDLSGKFHIVHSFDVSSEGRTSSEATLGADGSLYGTTFTYGTGVSKDPATIFKIDAAGKYSVIHHFDEKNHELPVGGLIVGKDGSLYGASILGSPAVRGTVYKIGVNGSYQVLHQFNKVYEGNPNSGLTIGSDNSLYGTTYSGGVYGYGAVYRIDPKANFSTLHHFDGVNGLSPVSVSFGKDGKLYGTASSIVDIGGQFETGPSILYKVGLDRSFKILYVFNSSDTQSKLTLAANGNFYGTEVNGGQYDRGTVFRIGFPVPTTLNLVASKLTSKRGENITFTVNLGNTSNVNGTITFFEALGGAKTLSYVALNNSKATFTSNSLTPGTHTIFAQFRGDGYFATSNSKPVVITVLP